MRETKETIEEKSHKEVTHPKSSEKRSTNREEKKFTLKNELTEYPGNLGFNNRKRVVSGVGTRTDRRL